MIKKLKVILDTNAVISMLSKRLNFTNIFKALTKNEYDLYITTDILLEYEEKITQFFEDSDASLFLKYLTLLPNIQKIETYYNLNIIINDPSDNKFVDCAFACNADYIVTNDKHFNILKDIPYPKIKIISISNFANLLPTIQN